MSYGTFRLNLVSEQCVCDGDDDDDVGDDVGDDVDE